MLTTTRIRFVILVLLATTSLAACGGSPTAAQPTAPAAATTAPQATEPPAAATTAPAAATTAPAAATTAPAANDGQKRELSGKITVAVEGALPVPGAPLTGRQEAWQKVLESYKQSQPNVEVVIEDLPAGQTSEVYCDARKTASTLPDIVMLGNCDYFRPSAEEIASGTAIATDFKPFETEANPYTGKPWKDDWLNDPVRLSRCQENGAVDMWTCMTWWLELKQIFVNWDILKEYGYTSFPKSLTELYDLSKKINDDGKYAAWDNSVFRYYNFRNNTASLLANDVFQKIGGDPNNLKLNPLGNFPHEVELLCNKTLWLSQNPSMQEVIKQGKRFIDANGGGALFYDSTREPGQQWLAGKAAFWWSSSEDQPKINQATSDGTFQVKNWSLEYLPNFTADELIDKNTKIGFDGKYYVEFGGQGDVFAPIAKVRASGEDANVDLMVRDFLQFLSSPEGQQRVIAEGLLPVNSVAFQDAPKVWVDALNKSVPESEKLYQGATQPPGGFMQLLSQLDPDKTEQAYMSGEIDLDTFMQKVDENMTREAVKRLKENLAQWGLTELPAACQAWDS